MPYLLPSCRITTKRTAQPGRADRKPGEDPVSRGHSQMPMGSSWAPTGGYNEPQSEAENQRQSSIEKASRNAFHCRRGAVGAATLRPALFSRMPAQI